MGSLMEIILMTAFTLKEPGLRATECYLGD